MPLGVGRGQNVGLRGFCHSLTLFLPGAYVFHKHMSCLTPGHLVCLVLSHVCAILICITYHETDESYETGKMLKAHKTFTFNKKSQDNILRRKNCFYLDPSP